MKSIKNQTILQTAEIMKKRKTLFPFICDVTKQKSTGPVLWLLCAIRINGQTMQTLVKHIKQIWQ